MKTIEERAEDYANQDHMLMSSINMAACYGYIAGAQSEREELLRWRDPHNEPPEPYESVLVKTANMSYGVGFYEPTTATIVDIGYLGASVIGWRRIYEETEEQ